MRQLEIKVLDIVDARRNNEVYTEDYLFICEITLLKRGYFTNK